LVDRIKFSANTSLIPQNLTQYQSKVISKISSIGIPLWDP
jgi:hypothetical protein